MIDVSHLTKRYPGGILAVENASFSVEGGDVVGLLGPNGAGKSTIMRILSGFVWPSGGEVRIAGMDVTREGMAVRKRIGYLPENCPLYPEMRVGEYLRYRANIKRVSSSPPSKTRGTGPGVVRPGRGAKASDRQAVQGIPPAGGDRGRSWCTARIC